MPKSPEFIIDLCESGSGRRGYLDPSCPHAVNHLMIGDLGNQEILLAACDDGDVISYTVHSLLGTIERTKVNNSRACQPEAGRDCQISSDDAASQSACPAPIPWLLENVGHSAWGLAIHKEARLVAVSSNTKVIDVFAPALRKSISRAKGAAKEKCPKPLARELLSNGIWRFSTRNLSLDRAYNDRFSLQLHTTNIPNITFANDDPSGRFLASTDIEANTFIWDLYTGKTVFTARVSSPRSE